jgi:hypothetical protein
VRQGVASSDSGSPLNPGKPILHRFYVSVCATLYYLITQHLGHFILTLADAARGGTEGGVCQVERLRALFVLPFAFRFFGGLEVAGDGGGHFPNIQHDVVPPVFSRCTLESVKTLARLRELGIMVPSFPIRGGPPCANKHSLVFLIDGGVALRPNLGLRREAPAAPQPPSNARRGRGLASRPCSSRSAS